MVPWQGLQGFTGAVAVGGLTLTSLFLLAAVFAPNLLLAIDVVAFHRLAIVAAIPLISLAYVVRLLTSAAAESLFVRIGRLRLADLADELRQCQSLASLSSHATNNYAKKLRCWRVARSPLCACPRQCNCCLLARGWRRTLISIAITCAVLSVGAALLSVYRYRSASSLAITVRELETRDDNDSATCPAGRAVLSTLAAPAVLNAELMKSVPEKTCPAAFARRPDWESFPPVQPHHPIRPLCHQDDTQ